MRLFFRSRRFREGAVALLGILITIAIVQHPQEAFEASLNGLRLWWDVVFPALLPFFIASEILMGLGVVHFSGALVEPLMQPLFKVPGVGGFVIAMGLASGYPIGAKITARLREKQLLSRVEAERLASFTNTADPLFMIGAVAVGMFSNPILGGIIAGAHYLSCLVLGFILRFHGPDPQPIPRQPWASSLGLYFSHAFDVLYKAREEDGRAFGELLGDSIKESVNTLLMVGGFIIFFAVLVKIVTISPLGQFLLWPCQWLTQLFGLDRNLGQALLAGTFEITLGCNTAAKAAAPLLERLIMTSAVIAWSGLSVHGQVAAIISTTDLRYYPYLVARLIHALLAGMFTILLAGPLATTTVAFLPAVSWAWHWKSRFYLVTGFLFALIFLAIATVIAKSMVSVIRRSVMNYRS